MRGVGRRHVKCHGAPTNGRTYRARIVARVEVACDDLQLVRVAEAIREPDQAEDDEPQRISLKIVAAHVDVE